MFTGRLFGGVSRTDRDKKPRDHPHDRRLAAARRPEDGEETAGRHREGDVVNSGGIAEPLNEVDAFQIWGHVNSV